MNLAALPAFLTKLWSQNNASYRTEIPVNASPTPGRASFDQGFPVENFTPGGVPFFGTDLQGALYSASAWGQAYQSGACYPYNAGFSAAIGGYPKGAIIAKASGIGHWVNNTDANTTDPDAGGAGWVELSIPIGTTYFVGNAGGTANALTATLSSGTIVDGFTIVVDALFANTATNPTMNLTIGGTAQGAKVIVGRDGVSPIAIGAIKGAGDRLILSYSTSGAGAWVLLNETESSAIYSVAMVGNSATVTVDPAKNAIIDITGSLSAQGAVTITLARSGQSFLAAFDNATSGGYPVVVNTNWTIPFGRSIWYYNHNTSTFEFISSSAVQAQIQSIAATVSANALTATTAATVLDFRSATLTSGTVISQVAVPALTLTVPSGATLGTVSGQAARLILLVAYNNGSPVLCVSNLAGGLKLDETNLISPTAISAGATSSTVIYSASAVAANSPYRVIGMVDITEATAGTWATAPTTVQGAGGGSGIAGSAKFGATPQLVTGSRAVNTTYYNPSGAFLVFSAVSSSGTNTYFYALVNGVMFGSAGAYNGASGSAAVFAIVPPFGSYSVVQAGTAPLASWSEMRF